MRRQLINVIVCGISGALTLPAVAQERSDGSAQKNQEQAAPRQSGDQQVQSPGRDQPRQEQNPSQHEADRQRQRIVLGVGFQQGQRDQDLQIAGIMPNSPADRAGLKKGDRILSVNGQEISSVQELDQIVQQQSIGDTAELVVLRDGQRERMQITFTEVPTEQEFDSRFQARRPAFDESGPQSRGWLGITIDTGKDNQRGVVIGGVYPAGPAARAGLQSGDLIIRLNGQEISSHEQLLDLLSRTDPGDTVELVAVTGNQERTVRVQLEDDSVFSTRDDVFDQNFTWRDPSGFSSQIGEHDMMLEQHRRFAEQHERLERLLHEVKADLEQIKQQLKIQSRDNGGQQ